MIPARVGQRAPASADPVSQASPSPAWGEPRSETSPRESDPGALFDAYVTQRERVRAAATVQRTILPPPIAGQISSGGASSIQRVNIAQDNWTAQVDQARADFADHIFEGDLDDNGDPTGFHSKARGSATHEGTGPVDKSPPWKGVYNQQVWLKANHAKTKGSTFFPDALNETQVIATIASARSQGNNKVVSKGKLKPGVPPQMVDLQLNFAGDTVYPDP